MDHYNELVEELAKQKTEGMSFTDIRVKLTAEGIVGEEQDRVIKDLNDAILEEALYSTSKKSFNANIIIGVFLIILGVGVTSATYFFNVGGFYILMYGPIIAGISLIGYSQMKSSPSLFERKSRFNRKR